MTISGRCRCGAVSYTADGEPEHHAICHCEDCRRSAGAPMVGWMAFKEEKVAVSGAPVTHASSEHARRDFCGRCGTGLFYRNAEMLPGVVDIQSATLDDPEAYPPKAHIQVAERLAWTEDMNALPTFQRHPG